MMSPTEDVFLTILFASMIIPLAAGSFFGTVYFSVWICKEIRKLIKGGRR